jgi:hypothetical protein
VFVSVWTIGCAGCLFSVYLPDKYPKIYFIVCETIFVKIFVRQSYVLLHTCIYRWTEWDLICPRIKRHGIVKIWMSFHHETTGFVIKYSESKPLVRNSRHVRKKIHLFNDISCFVTTITIRLFSFPCFVSISTIFTSALERSCGWILRFLSKLEENVIPIAVKSDYKTTVAETATAYKGTSVTRFEFHYRSSL